jgi:hypothetical protein
MPVSGAIVSCGGDVIILRVVPRPYNTVFGTNCSVCVTVSHTRLVLTLTNTSARIVQLEYGHTAAAV